MYTIRNLGVMPDCTESTAYGLNNLRQVTGFCLRGSELRPFFWSLPTGFIDLGGVDGPAGAGWKINDSGQVVGFATASDTYAFIWSAPAGMVDLGTLGGLRSVARAINQAGEVVGWAYVHPAGHADVTGLHAFIWTSQNGMQDLGTLGWDPSDASGINDLGIVVGNSRKDPNTTRAFIWLSSLGMFDMGTLGGVGSAATDINNSFQAVGGAQTASGADHAFLWDFGGMHDLGTLTGTDSVAYAINNKGDIVGSSARSAFLYQNGIMKDLNNVIAGQGWNLTIAWDINERGDIVGEGTHHGLRRAWLLENNEPEGNLGQAIIAAVTQILFGVIDDRGGLVIPPGRGPTPVPPHGPVWRSLSPGKREILLSLALDEVALRLKDQKTGRQVRGIALKTALREVKRMLDRLPKS